MENINPKKINFVNSLTNRRNEIICYPNDTYFIIKIRLGEEIGSDARQIRFYDEKSAILNNNTFVLLSLQMIRYEIIETPIDTISIEIGNNYFGIPRWILIKSNATVEQLKKEISNFQENSLQTFLFRESCLMSENNRTIESYKLTNDSKIKVWRGQNLLVTMEFHFCLNFAENIPKNKTLQFSMTDSISDVKERILKEIPSENVLNLALITDSSYWLNDKLLIDYPIRQERTEVYVVDLQMRKDITIENQIIVGRYAKIFNAKDRYGERLRVSRYKTNKEVVKKEKILKYAIISHILLNRINIHKFVELVTMYEEEEHFYIATEYIERGSLKEMYLKNPFTIPEIIRYSIQICEALDDMHSHKFLHRNLNCSSVLVDNENNIKLTNFHLSKYLFNSTSDQLLEGIPGSRIETSKCWLAPEVLRNDPYGLRSDIWSLAVTVLEMFTHDRPYPRMNVLRATHRIVSENTIEYDRNIIPEYFHDFLDQCLRTPHVERPSAKQCIQILQSIPIDNN